MLNALLLTTIIIDASHLNKAPLSMLVAGYTSIISVPAFPWIASTVSATGILIVVDAAIIIIATIPTVVCAWTSRTIPEKTFLCKMSIHKQRRKFALNLTFLRGLNIPSKIYLKSKLSLNKSSSWQSFSLMQLEKAAFNEKTGKDNNDNNNHNHNFNHSHNHDNHNNELYSRVGVFSWR